MIKYECMYIPTTTLLVATIKLSLPNAIEAYQGGHNLKKDIIKISVLYMILLSSANQSLIVRIKRSTDSVRIVYEFPLGVDIENIAKRADLGHSATAHQLYLLNSVQNRPTTLVHQLNTSSRAPIAETSPDVFAVIVGVEITLIAAVIVAQHRID